MASNSQNSTVLGVVVLTRHGDREGFYQSPVTYTPSQTAITPLGLVQEYQLGQFIRQQYFMDSSPRHVSGISTGLYNQSQTLVRADGGGEGGVIFDSAIAFMQGAWPADKSFTTTLANGTTVISPLGGYQYVAVESVEPENDISLEGWTQCNTFADSVAAFYNSTEFKEKASDNAAFLASLRPIVGPGRSLNLTNMWNIFDFLNVESIHNQNLSQQITPHILAQARDLANWHEYGSFSSPQPGGIGNIAGRTVLPDILDSLNKFANASQPLKFTYLGLSYKPFISLFNMTGVAQSNPKLAGIVNYASALTFELRQPTSGGAPFVRLNFKNGTDDADFTTYGMFGSQTDTPLSDFTSSLAPYQVDDLHTWCDICDNQETRNCNLFATPASNAAEIGTIAVSHSQTVSPVAAGFIGAGVTVATALTALGVLAFLGLLAFGRKRKASHDPIVLKHKASDLSSRDGSSM